MHFRHALALGLLLTLAGCGGTYGNDPFQPKPSGNITLSLVGGGSVSTSQSNPTIVHNSFSVAIGENGYSNYFTATIVSYQAPTVAPCYATPAPSNAVLTFQPQSAAPISGSGASPCPDLGHDVEGVRFNDVNGHTVTAYFLNS